MQKEINIGTKIGKFEVIGIRNIVKYGRYWTNTSITKEIFVKGLRGAIYRGWVSVDGAIEIFTALGRTQPTFLGVVNYDGEKGCFIGN